MSRAADIILAGADATERIYSQIGVARERRRERKRQSFDNALSNVSRAVDIMKEYQEEQDFKAINDAVSAGVASGDWDAASAAALGVKDSIKTPAGSKAMTGLLLSLHDKKRESTADKRAEELFNEQKSLFGTQREEIDYQKSQRSVREGLLKTQSEAATTSLEASRFALDQARKNAPLIQREQEAGVRKAEMGVQEAEREQTKRAFKSGIRLRAEQEIGPDGSRVSALDRLMLSQTARESGPLYMEALNEVRDEESQKELIELQKRSQANLTKANTEDRNFEMSSASAIAVGSQMWSKALSKALKSGPPPKTPEEWAQIVSKLLEELDSSTPDIPGAQTLDPVRLQVLQGLARQAATRPAMEMIKELSKMKPTTGTKLTPGAVTAYAMKRRGKPGLTAQNLIQGEAPLTTREMLEAAAELEQILGGSQTETVNEDTQTPADDNDLVSQFLGMQKQLTNDPRFQRR